MEDRTMENELYTEIIDTLNAQAMERDAAESLRKCKEESFYRQFRIAINEVCKMIRFLPDTYEKVGGQWSEQYKCDPIDYIFDNGTLTKSSDGLILWVIPNILFSRPLYNVVDLDEACISQLKYSRGDIRRSIPRRSLVVSNEIQFYQCTEISRSFYEPSVKIAVIIDNFSEKLFTQVKRSFNSDKGIRINARDEDWIYLLCVSYAYKYQRILHDTYDDFEFELLRPLSELEIRERIKEDLKSCLISPRYTNDTRIDQFSEKE